MVRFKTINMIHNLKIVTSLLLVRSLEVQDNGHMTAYVGDLNLLGKEQHCLGQRTKCSSAEELMEVEEEEV